MPPTALATVSLHSTPAGAGAFHVKLVDTSHTHRNADVAKRCAAITGVYLTELAAGSHTVTNTVITDHYGVNQTQLWTQRSGIDEGFGGYLEWDTGGHVAWISNSGIYDSACLHDAAVDARRLQTYRPTPDRVAAFNYIVSPVTFEFDITLAAKPKAVRLTIGFVGGNGGNPASHSPAFPDETLIIHV
jgi:hypothetical protein